MSKSSGPAGNVTTTQGPPQYMLPYLSSALGGANSLYGGAGPQYYPGQQVAGFSDPQQAGMAKTLGLGLGGTPDLNAATGFDATLLNAGGGNNPWLNNEFNLAAENTQGQLDSQFGGSGRNAEASAPLRAEQLNNLATGIYGGAYNTNINAALNAAGQAPGLYGSELTGAGAATGVGQSVRDLAQQQINANRSLFDYYQTLPYGQQQQYESFLSGVTPGMAQTSPYFTNPAANALGTGLGALGVYNGGAQAGLWGGAGKGAGSAAGVGSASTGGAGAMDSALAMFSDRRLKTDIERIGETDSGLPVYTFRYKGDPMTRMGVMADEVRKKQPHAVRRGSDGLDRVAYGLLH